MLTYLTSIKLNGSDVGQCCPPALSNLMCLWCQIVWSAMQRQQQVPLIT